jgi:hypothetical protein
MDMPAPTLRLPIDTSRVQLITTGAEAKRGGEKGAPAVDRETGEVLHRVYCAAVFPGSPQPQMWAIDVVGDPGQLPLGAPIHAINLEARSWEFVVEGSLRHGISLKADRVEVNVRPGAQSAANGKAEAIKS